MMLNSMKKRRVVASALLLSFALGAGGCYGRFPLTRAVYKLNADLGNEFEASTNQRGICKTLVMWGFLIIPVYGFATLADGLVLNLIEFWTGDQIEIGKTKTINGVDAAWAEGDNPNEVKLIFSRDGETFAERVFVRCSETEMAVRDAEGRELGTLLRDGSTISVYDVEGHYQGEI